MYTEQQSINFFANFQILAFCGSTVIFRISSSMIAKIKYTISITYNNTLMNEDLQDHLGICSQMMEVEAF